MMKVRFVLVLVLTFIATQYLNATASSTGVYALVTLPGTGFHELAHYMTALVMDGNPGNFNLIPSGNTLGSVTFHPNWWNAASVALAPLLLAPLTFLFAALAARTFHPLFVYFSACAWVACTPSPQDFAIAMVPSSWPLALVFLGFAAWAVYKVTVRMVR